MILASEVFMFKRQLLVLLKVDNGIHLAFIMAKSDISDVTYRTYNNISHDFMCHLNMIEDHICTGGLSLFSYTLKSQISNLGLTFSTSFMHWLTCSLELSILRMAS